jgi:hypothetical protein
VTPSAPSRPSPDSATKTATAGRCASAWRRCGLPRTPARGGRRARAGSRRLRTGPLAGLAGSAVPTGGDRPRRARRPGRRWACRGARARSSLDTSGASLSSARPGSAASRLVPPADPARRAGDKLETRNDDFVHATPGGAAWSGHVRHGRSLGGRRTSLTTASPRDPPGRTPVLAATDGREGTVAEVMMRAGRPVHAFVQDPGSAAAFALITPHEVLRVLIACC